MVKLQSSGLGMRVPPLLGPVAILGLTDSLSLINEGNEALDRVLHILEETQGIVAQDVQDHLHQSFDAYDWLHLSRTGNRADTEWM